MGLYKIRHLPKHFTLYPVKWHLKYFQYIRGFSKVLNIFRTNKVQTSKSKFKIQKLYK